MIWIPTTTEIYLSIIKEHRDLLVPFATFSNPYPSELCYHPVMETHWGFKNSPVPFLYAKTTWEIKSGTENERINEVHEYWFTFEEVED